jgi:hypothetical protein
MFKAFALIWILLLGSMMALAVIVYALGDASAPASPAVDVSRIIVIGAVVTMFFVLAVVVSVLIHLTMSRKPQPRPEPRQMVIMLMPPPPYVGRQEHNIMLDHRQLALPQAQQIAAYDWRRND